MLADKMFSFLTGSIVYHGIAQGFRFAPGEVTR